MFQVILPIHRCVLALYTENFPESCEKISRAYYSGGIQTHDPCISRAVSYQLDIARLPNLRSCYSCIGVWITMVPQHSWLSYWLSLKQLDMNPPKLSIIDLKISLLFQLILFPRQHLMSLSCLWLSLDWILTRIFKTWGRIINLRYLYLTSQHHSTYMYL